MFELPLVGKKQEPEPEQEPEQHLEIGWREKNQGTIECAPETIHPELSVYTLSVLKH